MTGRRSQQISFRFNPLRSIRLNSLSRLAYVPETGVGLPLNLSACTGRETSGYERMLVFYSRRLGSRQFQNGLVFTVTGLAANVSLVTKRHEG